MTTRTMILLQMIEKLNPASPQAFNDWAVLELILELLEEQKYDNFCYLSLTTKASDHISSFYDGEDRRSRRQHSLISELQQIVISHILRGRVCIMAHPLCLQGTQVSPKCLLFCSRRTTGFRWPLFSPLLYAIAYILREIGFVCASKLVSHNYSRHFHRWILWLLTF